MQFELAAIVLAAVVAVLILLLFCCMRQYGNECQGRGRPHALQFDDDLSRKHLLEEGEDEPSDQRSPSQKRPPPQNRYFVLGGHRFEATASGYRQIDDEAPYDATAAQNLSLHADDTYGQTAANNDIMIDSDANPKPRKTRHPLAVQFSAMAHAAEAEAESAIVIEPNATRQFMHDTKPSDNYVWPSKGGPATPIHVEWSGNTHIPSAQEENFKFADEQVATKDESELDVAVDETIADDVAPKEETGETQEQLVKTDQQIVPKPKSKKGKKKAQQQQQQQEQIET